MGGRLDDPRCEHIARGPRPVSRRPSAGRPHRSGQSSSKGIVAHRLPCDVEGREVCGGNRLYLPAEDREGPSFQPPQHLAVDPLPSLPTRSEGTNVDSSQCLQLVKDGLDDGRRDGQCIGGLIGRERAMGSGISAHHIAEGVVDRLEEHMWDPGGGLDTQCISQPRNVFDRRPPRDARG